MDLKQTKNISVKILFVILEDFYKIGRAHV